ncbi:methyltransferase, TIGR04325 family [Caldimonas thermodepolymerans]|jgi:hypothetical protein|uniref:Methyltransferase (TIGR04325 family) n=1 Tax=Caldimonas thermodepolymerans TaxID=215580 RepID=A0A2S5T7E4_9BURK|nr:TIGR04325 family methyltransferase [Caldimonas thermodepolymerans]PPE70910.1 methyltransferase, TIGR04325 family [Caldimonas thermodepolymerans]QPC33133.1 methyltransferase, TIGR04325 family [Caldimonas thermodepolymerans]RDI03925.1 putative methyltransferase (TIGR04325 family) [Caldimonas thermodepolymerans]TCP09896.1 putative methyltransferase (TIGR04325 family) [Caldimonas thermodepolymerans]UZG46006.1 TIGR04325 family methyltransferase [Caldimonas thermodepolymerans]
MNWLESIDRNVGRWKTVPGLRSVAKRRYVSRFLNNVDDNLFFGIFDSFDAAAASAPKSRPLGYDNDDSANIPYASTITPHDYPAVFWLNQSFHEGLQSVLDLGGHLGVKYYAFRRVIGFPPGLRWTVCDVPAVVRRGRELARVRDPDGRLHFTEDYDEAARHEVLFASGSLQYLPLTLAELLDRLATKPRRIVVNLTPIHDSRAFFTLNSIGTAFCAYRVQARERFIDEVRARGYVKRDEWQNPGKSLHLPCEDGYDVEHYSGFCFDREG